MFRNYSNSKRNFQEFLTWAVYNKDYYYGCSEGNEPQEGKSGKKILRGCYSNPDERDDEFLNWNNGTDVEKSGRIEVIRSNLFGLFWLSVYVGRGEVGDRARTKADFYIYRSEISLMVQFTGLGQIHFHLSVFRGRRVARISWVQSQTSCLRCMTFKLKWSIKIENSDVKFKREV